MKVGVLGGSFDPPHKGHLKIARVAIKKLSLDKILFIPCFKHLLKSHQIVASPFDRSNMVTLITALDKRFLVDNVELIREGVTFTVDTLEYLKTKFAKDEIYLLVGDDAYRSIKKWKDSNKIRSLSKIAVFPRKSDIINVYNRSDIFVEMKRVDISSTQIREKIKRGVDFKNDVTLSVYDYILKRNLYFKEAK